MPDFDPEKFWSQRYYAIDYSYMIGDIADFLSFSESNIEWLYNAGRQRVRLEVARKEATFPPELRATYRESEEEKVAHRFKVVLPMHARYAAVIALATVVEWEARNLKSRSKDEPPEVPRGKNTTCHLIEWFSKRADMYNSNIIRDLRCIYHVRNVIAHDAGVIPSAKELQQLEIDRHKEYTKWQQRIDAIKYLQGFEVRSWHFTGQSIYIEKDALNPYIQAVAEFMPRLREAIDRKGLLRQELP